MKQRQRDKQKVRHTEKQTEREAETHGDLKRNTKRDRHTERQTQRHRDREMRCRETRKRKWSPSCPCPPSSSIGIHALLALLSPSSHGGRTHRWTQEQVGAPPSHHGVSEPPLLTAVQDRQDQPARWRSLPRHRATGLGAPSSHPSSHPHASLPRGRL